LEASTPDYVHAWWTVYSVLCISLDRSGFPLHLEGGFPDFFI